MDENNNNKSKPFGYSLMIDMYDCCPYALDDLELHYRLLEELVEWLGMTKMTTPYAVHAPCTFERVEYDGYVGYLRTETYDSKRGVSSWVGLVESGLQIHSCVQSKFSTIDIYSCNDFRDKITEIKGFLRDKMKFKDYEEILVVRGTKYKEIV